MTANDKSSQGYEDNKVPLMGEKGNASEKGNRSWFRRQKLLMETAKKPIWFFWNLGLKSKHAFFNLFKTHDEISPLDDIKGAFGHLSPKKKGLAWGVFMLSLGAYLLSGVYTVEPGEEAVARIFGREVLKTIKEGLHYRLPWPIESIEKVNTMEVRRLDLGIQLSDKPRLFPRDGSIPATKAEETHVSQGMQPEAGEKQGLEHVTAKNQFLTGDENILEIKMNIQYRIKDSSDYLFNMNSPDSVIPYAARASITEIFGRMKVDDLLTVAKAQIQRMIERKTQKMLDEYGTGLHIINVSLQEVNPPKEVAQAFRDVASAKEEREEKINKAQGYRNAVIPEARGKAHKMVSNAEGYREEVINRARGEADKFSAMLTEYSKAKDVTEYRLYLETIEKILSHAKKFVVDSKKERVNLKFVK